MCFGCVSPSCHVQARRELERELINYQSRIGDPETEKKLKRQVKKYKALLEDTQEQLEHESEMRGNSSAIRSLKNQVEELQTSESSAVKNYKRLQGDLEELQIQYDDVTRSKSEVCVRACACASCYAPEKVALITSDYYIPS